MLKITFFIVSDGFATDMSIDDDEVVLNYKGAKRKYCPHDKYFNEQPTERIDTSQRLMLLRTMMKKISALQTSAIDGYIVTSDDEHQVIYCNNEYGICIFIFGEN